MKQRFICFTCLGSCYLLIFVVVLLVVLDTDPHAVRVMRDMKAKPTRVARVTTRRPRSTKLVWCRPLHYKITPGPVVALASFPGSGNTWLRYLLQQATGIYTGSIYKDYSLLRNGFPGESVSNGSVLVVKTHEWGPEVRVKFDAAILLVRDPYKAVVAEFNRQAGGHVGHAGIERYKKNSGKYWRDFVIGKGDSWRKMALDWLQFEGPLHVVRFENLESNLDSELLSILNFLNVTVTQEHFDCVLKVKMGIYKRKSKSLPFDVFSREMKKILDDYKEVVDRHMPPGIS